MSRMVPLIGYPSDHAEFRLGLIAGRKVGSDPALENQVREILEAVRGWGDVALLETQSPALSLVLSTTQLRYSGKPAAMGKDTISGTS